MSKELADAIRKRREMKIEVGRWKFIGRRPNDIEAMDFAGSNRVYADMALQLVIGWEGVTEDDVIGGGGSDPAPFSRDAWTEFCSDHSELWMPIGERLYEAYKLHAADREQVGKN